MLAATLLCMNVFFAMPSDAFQGREDTIAVRYRTAGKISDLRRRQAKTKALEDIDRDLLFDNDFALNPDFQAYRCRRVWKAFFCM